MSGVWYATLHLYTSRELKTARRRADDIIVAISCGVDVVSTERNVSVAFAYLAVKSQ